MPTLEFIMTALKSKGTEKNRITYARHGTPIDRTFGVSVADLKLIAKTIKKQQALALELYATGIMDAMYLAGLVADGSRMTARQLQAWAEGADGMSMIAEHTVAWVTVESVHARALASRWITSKKETVAVSGWSTWSGIVATVPDESLNLTEVEALLRRAAAKIHTAPNRVRVKMNTFVISAALYVKPLTKQAKVTAEKIGAVSANMGDTACEVPLAAEYIAKAEAKGRAGVKRKTIRC